MDDSVNELDKDGLLSRFKDWFKQSKNDSAEWREEAEESYDFVAGHQWSEEDEKILKEQQRPVITFNRCGVIVDAVSGMEVNNRQEMRYLPRRVGATGLNEMITGAVSWFRDESNAEDAESDAFRDAIICGMGWTDTRMSYEDGPEGKTEDERIDPLEMYWDTKSKKKNLIGGRFVMRLKESVSLEDAKAMFPNADEGDLDASWASVTTSAEHVRKDPTETYSIFSGDKTKEDMESKDIKLLQVQWWDRESYWRVQDPTTAEIKELSDNEYLTAAERYATLGIKVKAVKLYRKKYKQAFVGRVVLEIMDCAAKDRFTMQAITGKRDRKTNMYYALTRPMKDPQRWANKWLSQVLHIINSNSKGGLLAEEDAFQNLRKAKQEWSDPTSLTILKQGGLGKIREKSAITYPSGLDQLMQFAIASIRDVSGVNLEAVGLADREQAGVLEQHRKKAAMTVLATLFDSLRMFRKEKAHIYLCYVQNYLSNGQLIKIHGASGDQFVPLLRDKTETDYVVVVDDAPTSPNNKEQVWGIITQMLPMFADKMPPQMWAEILPYSPLPDTLTQKMSAMIMQLAQKGPDPKAEAAAEANRKIIEMQNKAIEAEAEKDSSQAALNYAKAKATMVDAGATRADSFVKTFEAAHSAIRGL